MEMTAEQKEIVACELKAGDILKVVAFAGTGKTTTLVEYAKARPSQRFLYVAFNKGVQLEAAQRFTSNVNCKTSHALAFPRFGSKYKDRLVSGFKANTVKASLGLESFEEAKFTIDTLMNYLVSSDARVSKRHIPYSAQQYFQQIKRHMPDLVALGNQLGKLMCTGDHPEIGMVHDGYLKLYQLSRPRLNYDCIFLDEAQDINPVTSAFLLSQPHAIKILVGDPHQQIYSFRGAHNSMDMVQPDHTRYLTMSFRFNKNIARVANMILKQFKQEKRKVIGLKKPAPPNPKGRITVIARTNAKVFDEAIKHIRNNKKIGFVGGIAGYRFNRILDAYHLYIDQNHAIKDPYIRSFDSIGEMEDYAKTVEDFELAGLCKVVSNYRRQIPQLVDMIMANAVDDSLAEVVLTTAHKAKGLEWPKVKMADDFPDLVIDGRIIGRDALDLDEFNLIYVSLTRAMDQLKFAPRSSLVEFIKAYQL